MVIQAKAAGSTIICKMNQLIHLPKDGIMVLSLMDLKIIRLLFEDNYYNTCPKTESLSPDFFKKFAASKAPMLPVPFGSAYKYINFMII